MPFIKLGHKDIRILIELIEEIEDLDPSEKLVLEKLKAIQINQMKKFVEKVGNGNGTK